jgi:hypothetical protein
MTLAGEAGNRPAAISDLEGVCDVRMKLLLTKPNRATSK